MCIRYPWNYNKFAPNLQTREGLSTSYIVFLYVWFHVDGNISNTYSDEFGMEMIDIDSSQ